MSDQNGNGGKGSLSFLDLYRADPPATQDELIDLVTSAEAAAEPWPAALAPEAYLGLAGRFVERVDPQTEADPVAVLVQFLAFFGNCCGRHAYWQIGRKRHYPNLFCVLVGPTAKGRKGTSLDWVEAIFRLADPAWADNCISTGLSSGEGLIEAVRDARVKRKEGQDEVVDEGVRDKRLLVVEEEFAQVLRLATRDGNILSATIRQAWDRGRLQTLTRQNPLKATDAHVSIVGHVTRSDLAAHLARQDQANGFANRFLWLASRRSKLLPDGGADVHLDDLADWLQNVLTRALLTGRMTRSQAARDLWHSAYPRLTQDRPGAFGLCTSRAEPQVLRLSLVYALLDGSDQVGEEHLAAALAVWDYCERSCRWVFGESVGDAGADEILDALRAAGAKGLTGREIHGLFNRHRSAPQLRKQLALLREAGLARSEKVSAGGRPAERWYYSGICEQSEQSEQSPIKTPAQQQGSDKE